MSTAAPYVSLVTLYTYAPNTQMVYSSILQGLLSKETELKAQQAENVRTTELLRVHLATATGVALVAAVKGKRSRQLVEKHNCTGCGKFVYHTLENCWTLHPEKREQHSNKAERKREGKRTRHSDSDSDVDDGTRRAARPFTSSGQPRASKRRSHHQSSDQSVERVLLTHTMVDQPTSQSLIRVSAKAFPAALRSDTLTDNANGEWYPSSGANSESLIRTSAKAFPAVVRSNTLTDKANGGWYPSSGAISESLIRVSGKAFPTALRSNTLSDSAIRIWYLDSGATKHICAQSDQMLDYMSNAPEHVLGIGNQPFPVHGSGNLALWWLFKRGQHKMPGLIRDVLHVPNANCNLLSVGQLQDAGFCVTFDRHDDVAMLEDADGIVWGNIYRRADGLYSIHTTPRLTPAPTVIAAIAPATSTVTTTTKHTASVQLWHDRLAHLGVAQMTRLLNHSMVDGIDLVSTSSSDHALSCDSCHAGKSHRSNMPRAGTNRAVHCLQLVHTDVCGPLRVDAIDGMLYMLTFIDDCSRYVFMYLTVTKSGREILQCFQDYHALAERASGRKLIAIRSDNGGEYINCALEQYLQTHGIDRQITPPYTPQHNGVAERANRTIFDRVRTMLHRSGLSDYLCPEAARAAVYIGNRCPPRALQQTVTPFEMWTGRRPNIGNLRVFGCIGHVHIPSERRDSKLCARSTPCVFVGYSTESKAYRMFGPQTGKVIVSRDVVFEENRFVDPNSSLALARQDAGEGEEKVTTGPTIPGASASSSSPIANSSINSGVVGDRNDDEDVIEIVRRPNEEDVEQIEADLDVIDNDHLIHHDGPHSDYVPPPAANSSSDDDDVEPIDLIPLSHLVPHYDHSVANAPAPGPTLRRSARGGGLPSTRSLDAAQRTGAPSALIVRALSALAIGVQANEDDPLTYSEAMGRNDHELWHAAMKSEMDSIRRTGTWTAWFIYHKAAKRLGRGGFTK